MSRAAPPLSAWLPCLALVAAALAMRLATLPGYVESVDGWAFVRGVERYSVLEARPHWPGYPLYIAAGRLAAWLTGDAALALHLISALGTSLAVAPLVLLAREWSAAGGADPAAAQRAGWTAGALWAVVPGAWLSGTEILSDPPALLVALAALLCAWRAVAGGGRPGRWLAAAAALGALLAGLRLAALPLLAPVVYAALRHRRHAATAALLFAGGVAAWLGFQLALDGPRMLDVALARLHEHFGAWPRRALEDGRLALRPARLGRVLLVHGLGLGWPGLPPSRWPATLAVGGLAAAGALRVARHPAAHVRRMWLLFGLPAGLVVAYGHDVTLARYVLPLVALACLTAGLGLPARGGAWPSLAAVAAAAAVSIPLARLRAHSPPVGHQLAAYLAEHADARRDVLVVTGDAPYVRVFVEALAPGLPLVDADAERLAVAPLAERLAAQGRAVFVTAPPAERPEEWVPAARFTRSPLLESRGPHALTLYRRGAAIH